MEFPILINWMSTFIFRGIGSYFSFLFHFSMKNKTRNRIAPDGTPRFAASHLGLFCLPMSHKKDSRLIWVNRLYVFLFEGYTFKLLKDASHTRGCYKRWTLPYSFIGDRGGTRVGRACSHYT